MLEELNYQQMSDIKGGVSREEYCKTMQEIASGEYAREEWTPKQWNDWGYAYEKNCMN